ncbi:amino acid aminotransferase [Mycolicibacterium moriokaense]|nr:amino acid aminotransferase [Mycolicibacterium moriokaense]
MTTAIGVPPADPESAALELLVDAAETATGSAAFRAILQDLAGLLHAEGALAGLAWEDARLVAAAVSFDACTAADPVGSLRRRAAAMRTGRGPRCVDSAGIAQAIDVAATVLDTM